MAVDARFLSEDERRAWSAIEAELRLDAVSRRSPQAFAAPLSERRLRVIAGAAILIPVSFACGVVAVTRLAHPVVLAPVASLAVLGALLMTAWIVRSHRCRP
ncbi:hypothetical protein [Embleya sp. NPDC050493]|uniref:hypothetical protein n=1 Tax=Embleya sp. NPDC050493 TaxID=3363989 RepID=UPI0037886C85